MAVATPDACVTAESVWLVEALEAALKVVEWQRGPGGQAAWAGSGIWTDRALAVTAGVAWPMENPTINREGAWKTAG